MHDRAIERFARIGCAARSLVYFMIGGYALQAAIGSGGKTIGARQAIADLSNESFGTILLVLIGAGLLGYAIWRLTQAFGGFGYIDFGSKTAQRIGWLTSAVTHLLLAYFTFSIVFNWTGGGQDSWAAKAMASDWGPWLFGAIGIGAIISGIRQLIKAWKTKFDDYLAIPPARKSWLYPVCRFGVAARGVVFGVIGWLFIQSAMSGRADSPGAGAALDKVAFEFGPWLLGLIAVGLLAFAVYAFVEALYRRIRTGQA